MSETASAPARERDLRNLLFDMEEDVLTVLGFFHAINAMGNSTLGLGPEQTNGLLRVAIAGLHSATALKEKWLAAFELAAAQREEAPMRERDTTQASDALTGAFWRAWGEYQFPSTASDKELDQRAHTVAEAYWAVYRTPAPRARAIADKLRLLKTQMDRSGEWADLRVELMLASALADVERREFDP